MFADWIGFESDDRPLISLGGLYYAVPTVTREKKAVRDHRHSKQRGFPAGNEQNAHQIRIQARFTFLVARRLAGEEERRRGRRRCQEQR